MRPTASPSRPYGRYAVVLRPSLDRDAYIDAPSQDQEAPIQPKANAAVVLTGPAPSGMTCGFLSHPTRSNGVNVQVVSFASSRSGQERRAAEREAHRVRGQHIGRPKVLYEKKAALARRMHATGESASTIAATLGVSRATVYRVLAKRTEETE